jgi:hypothetical protein
MPNVFSSLFYIRNFVVFDSEIFFRSVAIYNLSTTSDLYPVFPKCIQSDDLQHVGRTEIALL